MESWAKLANEVSVWDTSGGRSKGCVGVCRPDGGIDALVPAAAAAVLRLVCELGCSEALATLSSLFFLLSLLVWGDVGFSGDGTLGAYGESVPVWCMFGDGGRSDVFIDMLTLSDGECDVALEVLSREPGREACRSVCAET